MHFGVAIPAPPQPEMPTILMIFRLPAKTAWMLPTCVDKTNLVEPNKLILTFSEPVDFSNASFEVDNNMGSPF